MAQFDKNYWPMVIVLTVTIIIPGRHVIVSAQENAQPRIPYSLVECYVNADIYERDNRLPATVNTLIELIRKVEYSTDYNRDIKEVAVSLLHRFRMDGIERASGNIREGVLPFSPYGFQFSKHRVLLSRLIPPSGNGFPNNTLSSVERVNVHVFKRILMKLDINCINYMILVCITFSNIELD